MNQPGQTSNNPFDTMKMRASPIAERKRVAIEQILQYHGDEFTGRPYRGLITAQGGTPPLTAPQFSPEELKWLRENVNIDDIQDLSLQEQAWIAQTLGIKDFTSYYGEDATLGTQYYDEGILTPKDIPVDEGEWLKHRILNANWGLSLGQNLWDMVNFFDPAGKRDETDPEGKTALLPNIQNFLAALNEIGIKAVGNVPGLGDAPKALRALERWTGGLPPMEYSSDETPHLNAMIDAIQSRHNLSNPQVRHAFDTMLKEDPFGYLADASLPASVGTTAVARTTGAAARLSRTIGRIPRLKNPMGKAQAVIDEVAGVTRRADDFVNNGGTMPGSWWAIGGKRMPGIASMTDPGALTFDVATNVMTIPFRRRRNKMAAEVGEMYDPRTGEMLDKAGIDRKDFAAAAQTTERGAIGVAGEEARMFKADETETVQRLINTAENLDAALQRVVDAIDVGRPFDEHIQNLINAYDSFYEEYRGTRNGLYRAIAEREDVVMRLTNTFETLQGIMDEGGEWLVFADKAPYPEELAAFTRNIERFRGQAGDPDAPTDGADQSQPPDFAADGEVSRLTESSTKPFADGSQVIDTPQTPPETSKPSSNSGSPNRTVHSPADLNLEFPVTYEIIDAREIVPAHTSYNVNAPRRPQSEFPQNYQPKEIDIVGRQKIEDGARTLKPFALIDPERSMDAGAPIVDRENRIIGGNHRYWMVIRANEAYPDRYSAYNDYLKLIAPLEYNKTLEEIEAITDAGGIPMLVQKIGEGVDPVAAARTTNLPRTGTMSSATQARQHTSIVTDDALGSLNIPKDPERLENVLRTNNRQFLMQVLDNVDLNTMKEWETNGELNNAGYKALANIIHTITFKGEDGQRMMDTFIEIDTPGMTNIKNGLFKASSLPRFEMEIRTGGVEPEFAIANDIAEAINEFEEIRKAGTSINDALAQESLPGMGTMTETSKALLPLLAASTTAPSKLTNFIADYTREATESSAAANPLLNVGGPSIDKLGLITKLSDKHAAGGKLNDAIDELTATAKAEGQAPPTDGLGSGVQIADVVSEFKYINAERARTMFRELAEKEGVTDTQKRWARMMERAIDADMIESIEDAYPDKAAQIRAVYQYVWQMSTIINSKIAKSISRNFDDVFVKETGDTIVDQGTQLVQMLVRPNTSVGQIQHYRQLLGGNDSPGWKSFKRLFMESLLEEAFRPEGKEALVDRERGIDPMAQTAPLRHRPDGISNALNRYRKPFSQHKDAVLTEMLGTDTMESLYAVNELTRRLAQLYRNTNGSQTAFLQKKNLRNLLGESRLATALTTIGGSLMGVSIFGGVEETAWAMGTLAMYGSAQLLHRTFGKDAAAEFIDNFNRFKNFTPEEVSAVFRDTWAQNSYRALRNAALMGIRTQAPQRRIQRFRDMYEAPRQ